MRSNRTIERLIPLTAVAAILASSGCYERERQGDAPPAPTAARAGEAAGGAAPGATADQIREAPRSFYGARVQVSGEVAESRGERAFELDGTGWAFGDDITVLTRSPVAFAGEALRAGDEVLVAGTVRRFVTAEVERDLGWDLAPELETRLRERPVLVADSVRRTAETGHWSAEGAAERSPITSVLALFSATDLDALVGRPVDLRRVPVGSVMGKGLWIGPNRQAQVFVLPAALAPGLRAGDVVHVTGTLRGAPRDAERAWNLPANMAGVIQPGALFVDEATIQAVPEARPGSGT